MDLLKITLFLACLALSQCDKKLTRFLEDYKLFEVNARPKFPSRGWPQCFCIPQTSENDLSISDMLHLRPDSEEMRLVVYIFKDPATGEYKIYVPNKAKQHAFPDILYDLDETFRPVSDTFLLEQLLFDIHSWTPVKTKSVPTTTKPVHALPETLIIQDSVTEIINQSDKDKVNGLASYLNRFKETRNILGSLIGMNLKDKLQHLKQQYPSIYSNFVTKINTFFPIWLITGNIIRFKPGQIQKLPYDIKLISEVNGKRVIVNGQLQPHRTVEEILVYSPECTIMKKLFPEIELNSNMLFEEWLKIMALGLQKHLSFVSKTIDRVALKSFLLNVLEKQALSVTTEGHVVDSYGRKLKVSNIILRPILIGESGLINSVINNGFFGIQSNIVFLEALLFTANVFKSLGIVPISHILVGYQEENISHSTTVQIVETIQTCENNVCKLKKICKNLQKQEEPCQDFSTLKSGEAERSGSKCYGCKGKQCKLCRNRATAEVNLSTSQEILRQPLQIPTAYPATPIIMDRSGNVISTDNEVDKTSSLDYETNVPVDEGLGIRIVGGVPATHSGPPVNVKGR